MRDERIIKDAVFVIDDNGICSKYGPQSGWDFDDRGYDYPKDNPEKWPWAAGELISDGKKKYGVYLKREIAPIRGGKAGFFCTFELKNGDGYTIEFFDEDGNSAFKIMQNDGYFWCGDTRTCCQTAYKSYNLGIGFDLDAGVATLMFDGDFVGTYPMTSKVITRLKYGFDKDHYCVAKAGSTRMWTNYLVCDYCYIMKDGNMPYGWNVITNGNARAYRSIYYEGRGFSTYCISTEKGSSAKVVREFDKTSGKVCFALKYLTRTDSEDVKLSLLCGGKRVFTIKDTGSATETLSGKTVRKHNVYVWQMLRIEADTDTQKAFVKHNGKKCGEFDFDTKADCFDGIEISYETQNGGTVKFREISVFKIQPEPEDYVPAPVLPDKKDYYIGMNICSLWRNGEHWGWDVISPFDENETYMGYYDEGLPEVADWEIKWMKEHGLDFELYCWYNSQVTAPICTSGLSAAMMEGHFNAKYGDMMKFAIIWEGQCSIRPTRESYRKYIVPYWMDYFFTDPRYMVIDNKPVLAIFGLRTLINEFGSVSAVKEDLDYLRGIIKSVGFDDLIVMVCENQPDETLKAIGADAAYSYGWGKQGYDADFTKQSVQNIIDSKIVQPIPTVSVGFNNVAWADTRSPLATPEAMREVLSWFKSDVLPNLEGEDWRKKFVMFSTWNEYGEGTYICPANVHGFGYLDEMRRAFTNSPVEHEDVRPNQKQLDRLGYLFPKGRHKLAAQRYEDPQYASKVEGIINLNTEEELKKWTTKNGLSFWLEDGKMCGESHGIDPQMMRDIELDADSIEVIECDMKTGFLGKPLPKEYHYSDMTLYFQTEGDTDWTSPKHCKPFVLNNGNLIFHVSKNPLWKGKVTGIRIDPVHCTGCFSISYLKLLSDDSSINITVDGSKYETRYKTIIEDGEVYMPFEPKLFICSMMKLYHEWYKDEKTLMLMCGDKKVLFTEGKDTVSVDGKEIKFKKPLEFYDGVPMMPMQALCDIAGYKLTVDGRNVTVELD